MDLGLIWKMKGKQMKKDLQRAATDWGKTFLATALATYLAVGLDVEMIANAAIAAVLPSIINWLSPDFERYGRVR